MKIKKIKASYISEEDFKRHETELDEFQVGIASKIMELLKKEFPSEKFERIHKDGPMIGENKLVIIIDDVNADISRMEKEMGFGQYKITIERISDSLN